MNRVRYWLGLNSGSLPGNGGVGMADEMIEFDLALLSRMAKDMEDAKACIAREYPGVPEEQVAEVKAQAKELIEICSAFLKALDIRDEIERSVLDKTRRDLAGDL